MQWGTGGGGGGAHGAGRRLSSTHLAAAIGAGSQHQSRRPLRHPPQTAHVVDVVRRCLNGLPTLRCRRRSRGRTFKYASEWHKQHLRVCIHTQTAGKGQPHWPTPSHNSQHRDGGHQRGPAFPAYARQAASSEYVPTALAFALFVFVTVMTRYSWPLRAIAATSTATTPPMVNFPALLSPLVMICVTTHGAAASGGSGAN